MTLTRKTLGTVALTAVFTVFGAIGLSTYAPIALAVPLPPSDFNWTLISTTGGPPPARCYGTSTVYDALGDNLIVFGGNNCSSPLNDTWILSNASGVGGPSTWTAGPPGPFAPRANHTAVYDAANDRMIIFGGCLGTCLPTANDTWVLINASGVGGPPTWAPVPASNPPSPRNNHRAVYDPNNNRMILWSGHDGGGSYATTTLDVWVLTNANGLGGPAAWSQLAAAGGPPPGGYISSASYDPTTVTLTSFGGFNVSGTETNAVWVLSNANGTGGPGSPPGPPGWINTVPEGLPGAPSARSTAGTVIDLVNNRLMNFGGAALDTWVLTNANGTAGPPAWTQLITSGDPPAGTGIQSLTYDPDTNQMFAFVSNPGNTAVQVWRLSNANGIVPPPPPPPPVTVRAAAKAKFAKQPINIKTKGRTPMTVFGSVSFNVATINDSTVRFGANGTESAIVPATTQTTHVDKDGILDRIFYFQKSPTATPCGTTTVWIKGDLNTSGSFQGSDTVKIVPCAPPAG